MRCKDQTIPAIDQKSGEKFVCKSKKAVIDSRVLSVKVITLNLK
jgi:hypothetical protein